MIDIPRLRKFRVAAKPKFQRVVATLGLGPNYLLAGVDIQAEGEENIPAGPVCFAMNHTDRYNYWPFQYWLWRRKGRFTAAWIKAKYFEHPLMGQFFTYVNAIPSVSRGYVITKDYLQVESKKPSNDVYRALRDCVDGKSETCAEADPLSKLLTTPRSILGYRFNPARESYADAIRATHKEMTDELLRLSRDASDSGLDLLIFPEGTRSIRLSRGRDGLSQLALAEGLTLVPVGCNGSHRIYPGGSPIAKGGTITYRIGRPIHVVKDPLIKPFDEDQAPETKAKVGALTEEIMNRINDLLDEEHQFTEDKESLGVKGSDRFV